MSARRRIVPHDDSALGDLYKSKRFVRWKAGVVMCKSRIAEAAERVSGSYSLNRTESSLLDNLAQAVTRTDSQRTASSARSETLDACLHNCFTSDPSLSPRCVVVTCFFRSQFRNQRECSIGISHDVHEPANRK
jgi:hypothetical protein